MVWPLCWVAAARSAAGLSPFFGLEFLRGNKINLALYSSRRFLLSCEQENQTKSVSRSSTFALRGQIRPRARARRVNMAVYGGDPKSLRDNRRVGHTACERHVPLKTPRCGYGVGDQRKYRSSGRASSGCQPPARGKGKIRVSLTTLALGDALERSSSASLERSRAHDGNNTNLQFFKRETAAEAGLEVVSLRRRVHDRAKRTRDRARERLLRLEFTRVAARLLATGCEGKRKKTFTSVSSPSGSNIGRRSSALEGMLVTAAS